MNDSAEPPVPGDPRAILQAVSERLGSRLIGREALIERLLIALLTGGHLLLEGPPGIAKTRAVKEFAGLLDADFVRIQATPDLLPADITGTDVFDQQTNTFHFLPGPLFSHVVLVDEINRAPPKVQSALLEAMGEGQITSGGITRVLDAPFLVAATQNPIEHEGTYPLPEAQLDRFMFFIDLRLPDRVDERRILDQVLSEAGDGVHDASIDTEAIRTHATRALVVRARDDVRRVHLSEAVRDYIVRLVTATRRTDDHAEGERSVIVQAASPRGSICLAQGAQARAWLQGRNYATPDDVAALAGDVLSGRIALDYRARADGIDARHVVERLVATVAPV